VSRNLQTYIIDEDTLKLVLAMRRYTGKTVAELTRWAIRYYALHGPWHVGPDADRDADLGMPPPLEIGPTYSRRVQS
jgi:hypothetical protein